VSAPPVLVGRASHKLGSASKIRTASPSRLSAYAPWRTPRSIARRCRRGDSHVVSARTSRSDCEPSAVHRRHSLPAGYTAAAICRMCRVHLHPAKFKFVSVLNGLGGRDCMAGAAATANVSMILTPLGGLTCSRAGSDPRQPPQLQQKAVHNGRCVTLELRPGYNMSHRTGRRRLWHGHCRYNNQRGPKPVLKVKSESRELQESRGSEQRHAKPDTSHRTIKTRSSSTHKQATERPD
jgi:hypothetical protein